MFTAQGIVKPKRLEFDKKNKSEYYGTVSYTHLTLPTNREV